MTDDMKDHLDEIAEANGREIMDNMMKYMRPRAPMRWIIGDTMFYGWPEDHIFTPEAPATCTHGKHQHLKGT